MREVGYVTKRPGWSQSLSALVGISDQLSATLPTQSRAPLSQSLSALVGIGPSLKSLSALVGISDKVLCPTRTSSQRSKCPDWDQPLPQSLSAPVGISPFPRPSPPIGIISDKVLCPSHSRVPPTLKAPFAYSPLPDLPLVFMKLKAGDDDEETRIAAAFSLLRYRSRGH